MKYLSTPKKVLCVCEVFCDDCMLNMCPRCSDGKLFHESIAGKMDKARENLRWHQWADEEEGYLIKQSTFCTVKESLDLLRRNFQNCFGVS